MFEVPVPPGTTELIAIVEAIHRHYPKSLSLPQACDPTLMQVFVKENRTRGWLRRIFPQPDIGPLVELLREYLKVLAATCKWLRHMKLKMVAL